MIIVRGICVLISAFVAHPVWTGPNKKGFIMTRSCLNPLLMHAIEKYLLGKKLKSLKADFNRIPKPLHFALGFISDSILRAFIYAIQNQFTVKLGTKIDIRTIIEPWPF